MCFILFQDCGARLWCMYRQIFRSLCECVLKRGKEGKTDGKEERQRGRKTKSDGYVCFFLTYFFFFPLAIFPFPPSAELASAYAKDDQTLLLRNPKDESKEQEMTFDRLFMPGATQEDVSVMASKKKLFLFMLSFVSIVAFCFYCCFFFSD